MRSYPIALPGPNTNWAQLDQLGSELANVVSQLLGWNHVEDGCDRCRAAVGWHLRRGLHIQP